MSAKRQPADGADGGPQSPGPWGTTDDIGGEPPWGSSEDSPLDEGSEPTAVPEGRRWAERRAGQAPSGASGPAGRHGFGSVEPTAVPEAGPGGAPDPAPARRSFPNLDQEGDLPDNPLEWETGMRPET